MPTLTSATTRVQISTHGAELTSFVDLASGREYLWQADPAQWARHAPLLFPIVGKLPENTYLLHDQPLNLPQHGFARDQEFTVIEHDAASLTFQLMANPSTKAEYPFEFELRVRYELRGRVLTVGWHVRNPAAAGHDLLFSIGAHPAFNCPLQPEIGEQFSDYAFHFDHPVTLPRQLLSSGLRSGETAPVLENQAALPLSYELFKDDALVFSHFDFTRITLQKADKTGPFVRMQFNGFPYLGLWTKGPGANFVCIEPWHGVASPVGPPQELSEKEGILTLAPSQMFDASYTIEIG
ncbi:aldose 1-epimerase family protein [Hymenobacter ginsengisoli]|uniref:Aldose 1-epimerase family protein n=1 Tax=Hymenobacter ginsengisoli TaxID=1051626 RepID=A0ABP8QE78_9BACT|nr:MULTISPECIES: aldose 1-epimerase family protein [unclassified Hymenobacter]MBO2031493.1 aldose 1-epimerase family protein [Hymenobacter sp. BT559]